MRHDEWLYAELGPVFYRRLERLIERCAGSGDIRRFKRAVGYFAAHSVGVRIPAALRRFTTTRRNDSVWKEWL